jgi:hypothetical protein
MIAGVPVPSQCVDLIWLTRRDLQEQPTELNHSNGAFLIRSSYEFYIFSKAGNIADSKTNWHGRREEKTGGLDKGNAWVTLQTTQLSRASDASDASDE